MGVKEWLSRGRGMALRISELEREKQKAYELATNTVGHSEPDRVQTSYSNSSERKMMLYASIAQNIESEKEELLVVLKEINMVISSVEDMTLRRLLSMRYIEFMTWEQIAAEMQLSDKWVRTRLHSKALLEIAKIRGQC